MNRIDDSDQRKTPGGAIMLNMPSDVIGEICFYLDQFMVPIMGKGCAVALVSSRENAHPVVVRGDWGALAPRVREQIAVVVSEYLERGISRPEMRSERLSGLPDGLLGFVTVVRSAADADYAIALITSDPKQTLLYEKSLCLMARAIQADLAYRSQILKNHYVQALAESISDGFMVLNRDGIILYINTVGLSLLGVTKDVIGKNLRSITEFEPEILEVFRTGKGWIDKEFIIDLKTRRNVHLVKTAIPIVDAQGSVTAVVDTFKEIHHVRRLVNRMSGAQSKFSFSDIIYRSEQMDRVVNLAQRISRGESPVLIYGESGTGKELLAHAIHRNSPRSEGPFVVVDCSAIPHELAESELFGYVEGAFTGARRGGRPGKFEMASGGTVFLDEIGELPLEIQKKFLRCLESRSITRVGDHTPIAIDVRVISATNRNLEKEVADRNFREDLFFRLNVVSLSIPPLRERPEDIIPIAESLIARFAASMKKGSVRLSPEAAHCMLSYHWPGNVRELRNVVERALNLMEGETILPCDLPAAIADRSMGGHEGSTLRALERKAIATVLQSARGNKKEAARMLGISRSTLYEKMKQYGMR